MKYVFPVISLISNIIVFSSNAGLIDMDTLELFETFTNLVMKLLNSTEICKISIINSQT